MGEAMTAAAEETVEQRCERLEAENDKLRTAMSAVRAVVRFIDGDEPNAAAA